MSKKAISFVLVLTIVISLFTTIPIHSSAATEDESVGASSGYVGDCTWTLDEKGTLTISGTGNVSKFRNIQSSDWL